MLQEQKRLELEREERERKRQENEIQQIKDRHLKEKMQQISQTSHGQKILKKLNEDVSRHTFIVSPLHNYGDRGLQIEVRAAILCLFFLTNIAVSIC